MPRASSKPRHNTKLFQIDLPDGNWQLGAIPGQGWDDYIKNDVTRFKIGTLIILVLLALTGYLILFRQSQLSVAVAKRTGEVSKINKLLQEDIAIRKKAEAALQESEAKYQDLFDNAPDMYASVDAQTTVILECNQTLADMLGRPKDEVIGLSIFDIYTPESAEYARTNVFPQFVERGMVDAEELQLRSKDGSTVDVSLKATAIYDANGAIRYSRSILRDITEKKKLQSQLQQSQKMEAIGTLAGGIAHDFNNILGIIIGHAELGIDGIPDDHPARMNFVHI